MEYTAQRVFIELGQHPAAALLIDTVHAREVLLHVLRTYRSTAVHRGL